MGEGGEGREEGGRRREDGEGGRGREGGRKGGRKEGRKEGREEGRERSDKKGKGYRSRMQELFGGTQHDHHSVSHLITTHTHKSTHVHTPTHTHPHTHTYSAWFCFRA